MYLHKMRGPGKTKGSVSITNKLRSIQRKVTKSITGGLSTTARDVMDMHAYILPVDLLFSKILFRASLHLCLLPTAHPLHHCVHSATRCKVKHHLMSFVGLDPKDIETISPVRKSPGYNPVFSLVIPPSTEAALPLTILTNDDVPVRVYSNSSGFESGIGASALLYIKNWLTRVLRSYLGTAQEHTVYEAEGVGLILGFHLLHSLMCQLTHPTISGTDSQVVIRSLSNQ